MQYRHPILLPYTGLLLPLPYTRLFDLPVTELATLLTSDHALGDAPGLSRGDAFRLGGSEVSFLAKVVTNKRPVLCLLKWQCVTRRIWNDWIDVAPIGLDTCASCGETDTSIMPGFYASDTLPAPRFLPSDTPSASLRFSFASPCFWRAFGVLLALIWR